MPLASCAQSGQYALVLPGRFRHLTDPTTYADDVLVKVSSDRSEAWVSEQLVDRLMAIGRAYRLHVLTMLGDASPLEAAWVNRQQAEALMEEMESVGILVDVDSAMCGLISTLLPLVAEAARYGDGNALVVERP